MKQDDAFPILTELENTHPIMRVGAFVIACGLIFFLWAIPAKDGDPFEGFLVGAFIGPCFLYCYAGVSNPITKTLLGLGLLFAPLALLSDMDSPIDARLKGDTSNPNYWRQNKK